MNFCSAGRCEGASSTSTASAAISARTRDQVAQFFDGLEMIGPGLVDLSQWLAPEAPDNGVTSYVGIGRKPGAAS